MSVKPHYHRTDDESGTKPRTQTLPIRIKIHGGRWLFISLLISNLLLLIALVAVVSIMVGRNLT